MVLFDELHDVVKEAALLAEREGLHGKQMVQILLRHAILAQHFLEHRVFPFLFLFLTSPINMDLYFSHDLFYKEVLQSLLLVFGNLKVRVWKDNLQEVFTRKDTLIELVDYILLWNLPQVKQVIRVGMVYWIDVHCQIIFEKEVNCMVKLNCIKIALLEYLFERQVVQGKTLFVQPLYTLRIEYTWKHLNNFRREHYKSFVLNILFKIIWGWLDIHPPAYSSFPNPFVLLHLESLSTNP